MQVNSGRDDSGYDAHIRFVHNDVGLSAQPRTKGSSSGAGKSPTRQLKRLTDKKKFQDMWVCNLAWPGMFMNKL